MGLNPRRLQRHLRILCLAAAAAGVFYLYTRYDLYTLPEEGCSPLMRFSPGNRLLLDRNPPRWERGDAGLFAGPDGRLYLGIVREVRGEPRELWLETDADGCPGADSDEFGWIPVDRLRARVMMAW